MSRFYKKRYSRRSSRKYPLSKKNIYMHYGGRSQANQIASLNRKLSILEYRTRPETKILQGNPATFSFTSTLLSSIWDSFGVVQPSVGPASNQRVGDKIYEKTLNVQMYFEYYNNSTTGYHDSESAGGTVRIFAVQSKTPGLPSATFNLEEFISDPAYQGADYNILPIKPFRDHISESWKILYDKCFTMTTTRNQKLVEFDLHPGTLEFDADGNHYFIKVYILASGLHWDTDFKETIEATCNVKCVYTDI